VPGLISEGHQGPHDLNAVDDARPIIVRALSYIPAVEVTAHHDVAVGMLCPSPFGDDVGLRFVIVQDAAHLEAHADIVAIRQQSGNATGIHGAHRRSRHPVHGIVVPHGSGVRERIQGMGQRPHQRRHTSMIGRLHRPA
jgi:hypothetical protein